MVQRDTFSEISIHARFPQQITLDVLRFDSPKKNKKKKNTRQWTLINKQPDESSKIFKQKYIFIDHFTKSI